MADVSTVSISYQVDEGTATGYLAQPEGTGPFAGIVVVQEWWGLDSHIQDVAERFAKEGFVALAPDLYHGQVTEEAEEARRLAMSLDRDRAVKEIDSVIRYIKQQPYSSDKVGIVGYCMGGGLVMLAAIHSDIVDAANVYYGGNPDPIDQVQDINCPILGLYAGHDEANRPSVPDLEAALQRHGKQHECIVYPDAPHAFFNDQKPNYRDEAARDAWRRTLAFFRQHLK
jgi:carboxymethylenebutenolidase